MKPKHAILLAAAVVLIGSVLIVANCSRVGETTQSGEVMTMTISRAKADAQATFSLVLMEGTGAEHEAAHIFEAVDVPAVEKATLNTSTVELTVYYDNAQITAEEIMTLLTNAGYAPR